MRKSFLSTAILGGFFLLLCAWFFLYENSVRQENDKAEEENKRLIVLKSDDIKYIALELAPSKGKKESIQLQRLEADWRLISPVEDLADGSAIRSMLSSLTTATEERTVEESASDLEPYGLKTPEISITVKKSKDDEGETLFLGSETPVGYGAYAKTAKSSKVVRIAKSLRNSLNKNVTSLRNKKILAGIARSDITELEITARKENIVLRKDDKEAWTLARTNIPADKNKVNKTLNALVDAKAQEFVSGKGAHYGLNRPLVTALITQKGKKPRLSLKIGKKGDKFYAKRADSEFIYEVKKNFVDKVNLHSENYTETSVAKFNRFNIKRFKLEKGTDSLEFAKEDSSWKLSSDPKLDIDNDKVDNLLATLQDVKIAKYNKSNIQVDKPSLTVRLFEKTDSKEEEKVVLKFANPSGKRVNVQRKGLTTSFQILKEDFEKINQGKESFIKKPEKKAQKTDAKNRS